jgi:hypothetical protein
MTGSIFLNFGDIERLTGTKIITMGQLISRYMVKESLKKAHCLGHLHLQDVTTVHIAEYYELRSEEASVRPNRELSLPSIIFEQAPFLGVDVIQDILLVPDIYKPGEMLQIFWNDLLCLTLSKIRSLNNVQNDFFFTNRTGKVHNNESFKIA